MKLKITHFIVLILFLFNGRSLLAQQENESEGEDFFTIDTPVTIDFEEEEEERVAPKKKKPKKGVFYDIKTRKGFTKIGYGENIEIELFHYLKEYQEPNEYVQEIHWFDIERQKIRVSKKVNQQNGLILHGPYKKTKGDQVIEEGVFYIGTKHGRWTKYDKNGTLIDKQKYYKGWPKESLVRYYDEDRSKMKEIIPVIYGQRHGSYYHFYENGNISVKGKYANGNKIGIWTEYYPFRNRRKKEVQFADDSWDSSFQSYILREWNERGRVVFDRVSFNKKTGV